MSDLSQLSDDELRRLAGQQSSPLAAMSDAELRAAYKPTDPYTATAKSDSNLQNLGAAVGGAMYAPYLGVKQMLGKAGPQEVADWKQSMAGLWSTPMGKVGTVAGGAVTAAPLALVPGANTMTGAALGGLAYGAAQPVGEGDSRLTNAVEGMGGGVAGKVGADLIGKGVRSMLTSRVAAQDLAKVANAPRDATIAEARAAGYVFPPSQINPSPINRILEGTAGKLTTAQSAAGKNQEVTNSLARQSLGLPDTVPLTTETLQTVRKVAGTAYSELKKFGPIQVDNDFQTAMQGVTGEYASLAQNYKSMKNPAIDELITDLNKPAFSSSDAVELVKRLRYDGFRNVKSPEPGTAALGKVQLGAQNAIEDLIDRNLSASNNAGFLDVFRNARTMIAKSHTVENALEESTGKVIASKIGREFSKGRPLTGELAAIGKTAEAFPKAVQNINTSMPGMSPLDAYAGILGSAATGNPAAALLSVGRPFIRSGILSKPYQAAMINPPSYGAGLLGPAASITSSDATKRLLQSLGLSLPATQ